MHTSSLLPVSARGVCRLAWSVALAVALTPPAQAQTILPAAPLPSDLTLLARPATALSPHSSETYSKARVWLGPGGMRQLQQLGVAVDHGDSKPGVWFESDFSGTELRALRQAGLRCDISIADVSASYRIRNVTAQPLARPQAGGLTCDPVTRWQRPQSFRLGSMGGFFTLDEIYQKLDSMAIRWPNLITTRQSVGAGTTHEGRSLYWVKISDNPNTNEAEPEMLYNGVHHAREPMSVAHLLYYMYFLLENYATNPEVRALVNNTELYFIPVVNPDGYAYNEMTNPTGGGMWRKNRRDNQDGTFGVDLNRNYGASWGIDDDGSSPDGWSEVFRGPSAFSEPETQLVRDFSLAHSFKLALNYHSFGNVFIYPFGYAPNVFTPDSAQYADYGRWLSRDDRYSFGTCNQVLGYVSNGDANDWQYTTVQGPKPKTFSFTPEIGKASEGFWPFSSRIEPLCYENLTRDIDAARLLLAEAIATDASPRFFRQRTAWARYSLKQLGLTPGTYSVSVEPLTGAGTAGAAHTHSLTTVRQTVEDSIQLTLPASLSAGQTFRYVLSVNNGLFTRRDTLTKVFGTPTIAFASNGASMAGWAPNTSWGVVPAGFGATPGALNDSPAGDYASFADESLTTAQPIDLRGATHAELSFRARWAIETRFDFAQVLVSTDNGNNWQPLCGKLTRPGNAFQRDEEPLFDGFVLNWVRESISLDDFVGQQILLRFNLQADNQSEFDGLTIDDIRVERISSVTGLAATAPATGLGIFPNPAHDVVTLVSSPAQQPGATVRVFDGLGREVYAAALPVGVAAYKLPVRGWAAGVYAVRVQEPGRAAATARFTVE